MAEPFNADSQLPSSPESVAAMEKYGITKKPIEFFFMVNIATPHCAMPLPKRSELLVRHDPSEHKTFGGEPMALRFPNISRSLESGKSRIRFWGYDSAIEITFFMELDALMKISPAVESAETGLLDAFDCALERIHQVAAIVYQRNRERSNVCVLAANDF